MSKMIFLIGAVIFIGLLALVVNVAMKTDRMPGNEDEPVSSGSQFFLAPEDFKKLNEKADLGDKDAAFRIYQFYAFVRNDENLAQDWLKRAATLGHEDAAENLRK